MSIVYFQSFCRVYQASGKGSRLYHTVTDYTPFGVLGQTVMHTDQFNKLLQWSAASWQ